MLLRDTALVVVLALISAARADDNGRARRPPMGWRDWNQFQGAINQELMELAFHGLADMTFGSVGGKPTSLATVGYTDAGLDDVWQQCGKYGPENYTYHDAAGHPVVDTTKFPDMKKMTDVAHALGLTAGWYGNNCRCGDHCATVDCFAGDVNATLAYGFDSIKLDGCGKEEDVALWNEMFNHSIRVLSGGANNHSGMMIENAHNGGPAGNTPHYDAEGELQCPFHTYRSSADIRPQYGSMLANLMSIPPLARANLSVPGCWAYVERKKKRERERERERERGKLLPPCVNTPCVLCAVYRVLCAMREMALTLCEPTLCAVCYVLCVATTYTH